MFQVRKTGFIPAFMELVEIFLGKLPVVMLRH